MEVQSMISNVLRPGLSAGWGAAAPPTASPATSNTSTLDQVSTRLHDVEQRQMALTLAEARHAVQFSTVSSARALRPILVLFGGVTLLNGLGDLFGGHFVAAGLTLAGGAAAVAAGLYGPRLLEKRLPAVQSANDDRERLQDEVRQLDEETRQTLGAAPLDADTTKSLADVASRLATATTDNDESEACSRKYLSHLGQYGSSELERQVASASLKLMDDQSSYAANVGRTALGTLAAGISGPIGVALMEVGDAALSEVDDDNKVDVGNSILEQVAAHSTNEAEVAVLKAARAAADQLSNTDGNPPQDVAFDMMREGVSGTPEEAVANFGDQVLQAISDEDDQNSVGSTVMEQIRDHSANDDVKAMAKAALDAAGETSDTGHAVLAYQEGFNVLKAPASSLVGALSDYGVRLIDNSTDTDECSNLADSVLHSIESHASGAAEKALAKTMHEAINEASSTDATDIQREALNLLRGGVGGPAEKTLAQFGVKLLDVAADEYEGSSMGSKVLENIVALRPDDTTLKIAQVAQENVREAPDSEGEMAAQRAAFKTIIRL